MLENEIWSDDDSEECDCCSKCGTLRPVFDDQQLLIHMCEFCLENNADQCELCEMWLTLECFVLHIDVCKHCVRNVMDEARMLQEENSESDSD
jgi:hypothetical protein